MLSIDQTKLRAIRSSLRFEAAMPPREAVAALFALANPTQPDHLVTSRRLVSGDADGAVAWHVLARAHSGLAVVAATADEPWDWGVSKAPRRATVDARWVPLSAVRSVGVREVRVLRDHFDAGEVAARFDWSLQLSEGDTIVYSTDASEDAENHHQAFFESLLSDL